jgi:hypothetical protein
MKFIVQSFSDIITNSSSEVFVSSSSDELLQALKELNIDYDCYHNEEELRKAVEEDSWDFDEIVEFNPYREWWFDDIKSRKTCDELWDFFKVFYMDLIGKIIIDVDRDYLYTQVEKHSINLLKFIKE